MVLIQLAPVWSESLRDRMRVKIADLERRAAEAKVTQQPHANGKPKDVEPEIFNTDAGNAHRFAKQHRGRAAYCKAIGWLLWAESHWQEDRTEGIDRLGKATIRAIFAESRCTGEAAGALIQQREATDDAANDAETGRKQTKSQRLFQHALKSESAPRLAAMIRLARSELAVVPEQLDGDPYLFNVLNGTIELHSGTFRPHRREDYITKVAPVTYDAAAKCPQWERALRSIFPESPLSADAPGDTSMIGFVQRLCGMFLAGDVTAQVLTIFYGEGSNAKSTFLEAICALLGPYAGPAPDGLLLVRRGEQHPTELADLFGKRLIHSTETGEGARLDEQRVKKLTGGDTLKGRRMRQDFWSFTPTHKLLICTNHRPKIRGTDHAIWRRVLLVPFAARFWKPADEVKPGEVRIERFRANEELVASKFQHERPGILNWLLAGFRAWKQYGLNPPAAVQSAVREYRTDEDPVALFISQRCKIHSSDSVKTESRVLWAAFEKWSDEQGERFHVGRKSFTRRIIQATGFSVESSGRRRLPGISLVDEETTENPQLDIPD